MSSSTYFRALKRTTVTLLLACLTLHAVSVDVFQLSFEDDGWKDILPLQSGHAPVVTPSQSDAPASLEIRPQTTLETQSLPYRGGTIHLSLDYRSESITRGERPWHRAWITLVLYDHNGESLGHKDIINSQDGCDWQTRTLVLPQDNLPKALSAFSIRVTNLGTEGRYWLGKLSVSMAYKEGKQLCGDGTFAGSIGVDHWTMAKDGSDWDGLALTNPTSPPRYSSSPLGETSSAIHMTQTGTYISNRFAYHGEALILSGWMKTQDIVRHSPRTWAKAGMQLVYYNTDGEVIGHLDLKLTDGTTPWTYYCNRIDANRLKRNIAALEIWLRVFDQATGDAWFDNLSLVRLTAPDQKESLPYAPDKATVTIHMDDIATEVMETPWAATDLSYLVKLRTPIVREILEDVRARGITQLRTREVLQGCGILEDLDDNGKPVYDWEEVDRLLDMVVRDLQFDLTMTMESTPDQISSKPLNKKKQLNNRYPPNDTALWGQIVYDTVDHWINRYGLETVASWRFECWNEPKADHYFKGTSKDFVQIWEAYMDAMIRIEQTHHCDLQIGTFSGTSNSYDLYEAVFTSLKERNQLQELKFLSMHVYAGGTNSFDYLSNSIDRIRKLANRFGLGELPLDLTEVNLSSMGSVYRDSHVSGAFAAKTAKVYLDKRLRHGHYFGILDYQFGNRTKQFVGGSGLYTKAAVPKTAANALTLLNRMRGTRRVSFATSNNPVDGIASWSDDGVLRIMLTSFDELDLDGTYNTEISLQIQGTKLSFPTDVKLIRIAPGHADSYSTWLAEGQPLISDASNAKLIASAQPETEQCDTVATSATGIDARLTMHANSVLYLEFTGLRP